MVLFLFLLCCYKTFKIKEYTEECIQGILMEKVKLLIVLNILPHCLKNLYSLTVHGGCRCRVLIFRRNSFKNILVNSKLFFLTLRLFSHHWTGSKKFTKISCMTAENSAVKHRKFLWSLQKITRVALTTNITANIFV